MFFQAQETVLSAIGGCSVEQGLFFAPSTVRDPSSPLWAPMRDYLSSRVCKKTLKKLIISER